MSIGEMIDDAIDKNDAHLAAHIMAELARDNPFPALVFVSLAVKRAHPMEAATVLAHTAQSNFR